jgi:transposase
MAALTGKIAVVTGASPGVGALYGIGPVVAGRILAETGDVAPFATKDESASYNGTAPTGVSAGARSG